MGSWSRPTEILVLAAAAIAARLPTTFRKQRPDVFRERMFDLLDRSGLLGFRVADADFLVELLVDGHIHEFVDGRRNDCTAKLEVEHRQIAAADDETHAQGCFTDDHINRPPVKLP